MQRIFLAVALGSIIAYSALNFDKIATLCDISLLRPFLYAAALMLLVHPIVATAFYICQRGLGIPIAPSCSISMYLRRLPAKYIPGGIWHSLSRYADLQFQAGTPGRLLAKLFAAEFAIVAVSGLMISSAAIIAVSESQGAMQAGFIHGLLGAFGLVIGGWFFGGGVSKRLLPAVFFLLMVWVISAFAFTLLALAIADTHSTASCSFAVISTFHLLATVQGYLAVFAPQGWGVSEASFMLFVPCPIPLYVVISSFLLFRLAGFLADLLAVGTLLFFETWTRARGSGEDIE